jgi:hypothetical protein
MIRKLYGIYNCSSEFEISLQVLHDFDEMGWIGRARDLGGSFHLKATAIDGKID